MWLPLLSHTACNDVVRPPAGNATTKRTGRVGWVFFAPANRHAVQRALRPLGPVERAAGLFSWLIATVPTPSMDTAARNCVLYSRLSEFLG